MSGFGVALIAVFWVYDGWVYITWVAGEVKQPGTQCSATRCLYGIGARGGHRHLLINILYLYAMPMATMAQQPTVGETRGEDALLSRPPDSG